MTLRPMARRFGNLLYKHIHALHHTYRAPFVWVTQYVHPVELIATGLFAITGPMVLGAHPLVAWLWLCLSVQLRAQ